jgi:ABC-type glycerol-3-phosphate transport system substrate-binding protein
MKKFALGGLLAGGALLLAACGQGDDGSPTAADNEQLNEIAGELDTLDTSPDSLVVEDPVLGNGESAETGDVLVADQNSTANVQ